MYLIQMCLLFLQTMVSLANELPIVLEIKQYAMYVQFCLYCIFEDNANNLYKFK